MRTNPLGQLRFAGLHENLGETGGLFCYTINGIRGGDVEKKRNNKCLMTKLSNQ